MALNVRFNITCRVEVDKVVSVYSGRAGCQAGSSHDQGLRIIIVYSAHFVKHTDGKMDGAAPA